MINDKDYDALKYPVHKKPVSKMPELMALDGMNTLDDKEIAYIVYFYDRNSPLNKIGDWISRKEFAADKAGFDVEKDDLSNIFELSSPVFRKAIISYLRNANSLEFAALVAFEQRFYENLEYLLKPLEDDDDSGRTLKAVELKGKLENSTQNLIGSIVEMRDKIFGNNSDSGKITEMFTPEYIANVSGVSMGRKGRGSRN
jgi:hypothetical protein